VTGVHSLSECLISIKTDSSPSPRPVLLTPPKVSSFRVINPTEASLFQDIPAYVSAVRFRIQTATWLP
jgi:hypothetical protein